MTDQPDIISNAMLLERVQAMEDRMVEQISGVRSDLTKRADGLENKIDSLEVNLTRQIDGIDARLDAVEIENLPKRVQRLEEHAGLAVGA